AEQDERDIDGSRSRVQQAAIAWEEILHWVAGDFAGGARIGEGSAATESRCNGDVRIDAAAIAGQAGEGSAAGRTGKLAQQHTECGAGDRADLDSGSRRSASVLLSG